MRAVSEDKGAAALMGINVNKTISMTFAIGSALAAVAGILFICQYESLSPTLGALPGIKAFVAAVLGGIGSIPGAMLGGVVLGIIESVSKAYISTQLADAIDLTLVHFTDVDSQKHDYGTGSPEAWAAMERHSERLMEIQDLLERLDMAEDTIFVLLGDHSQKDVEQMICLNALFREKGWIRGRRGRVRSFRVYAKSCDGSAYIYVRDKALMRPVYELIAVSVKRQGRQWHKSGL